MPPPLVLARHGQTEWNFVGRRQGQLDSPLTSDGVLSARRLVPVLSEQGVDIIVSSPIGRARRTAEIFSDGLQVSVIQLDELAEVHHGTFAGLTNAEIEREHSEAWRARGADFYGWKFPGGESYEDADHRAVNAIASVRAMGASLPLLVTHEMIGRMLRRQLLGLTVDQAFALRHPQHIAYRIQDGRSRELS